MIHKISDGECCLNNAKIVQKVFERNGQKLISKTGYLDGQKVYQSFILGTIPKYKVYMQLYGLNGDVTNTNILDIVV